MPLAAANHLGDSRMSDQQPSDEELQLLLQAMFGAEPAPPAQAEFAIAAFDLPKIDEELAELVFDSTDIAELAGVRSGNSERVQLSFAHGNLSLDAEWESTEPVTITGQFEAPAPRTLTMHRITGSTEIELDDHGEFEVHSLIRGPIRFSGQSGEGRLETDWFSI